jgi:hypothetical protein
MRVGNNPATIFDQNDMAPTITRTVRHNHTRLQATLAAGNDRLVQGWQIDNFNNYSFAEVARVRRLYAPISTQNTPVQQTSGQVNLSSLFVRGRLPASSNEERTKNALTAFHAHFKSQEITPDMNADEARIAELMNQLIADEEYVNGFIHGRSVFQEVVVQVNHYPDGNSQYITRRGLVPHKAWEELQRLVILNSCDDTKNAIRNIMSWQDEVMNFPNFKLDLCLDLERILTHGADEEKVRVTMAFGHFLSTKATIEGLTDAERLLSPGSAHSESNNGPQATFTNKTQSVADIVNTILRSKGIDATDGSFSISISPDFTFRVSGGEHAELVQEILNSDDTFFRSIFDSLFNHRGENGETLRWLYDEPNRQDIFTFHGNDSQGNATPIPVFLAQYFGIADTTKKINDTMVAIREYLAMRDFDQMLYDRHGFTSADFILVGNNVIGKTPEATAMFGGDANNDSGFAGSYAFWIKRILQAPPMPDFSPIEIIFADGKFSFTSHVDGGTENLGRKATAEQSDTRFLFTVINTRIDERLASYRERLAHYERLRMERDGHSGLLQNNISEDAVTPFIIKEPLTLSLETRELIPWWHRTGFIESMDGEKTELSAFGAEYNESLEIARKHYEARELNQQLMA